MPQFGMMPFGVFGGFDGFGGPMVHHHFFHHHVFHHHFFHHQFPFGFGFGGF